MHFILILKHTSSVYHLIQTPPSHHTAHTERTPDSDTAALDTPAVTSNTAIPANYISKCDITMSKRGNLRGNKTTQQTNKHDINSTANEEIKSEETKNLLQK